MKSIVSILIICTLLLSNDLSDNEMSQKVGDILNNKQTVYTTSSLVKAVFGIKDRGEFETKEDYAARVSKDLGDGIFYVYEKITTVEYDIDKKIMKFYTPLQGGYSSDSEEANPELKKQGYTSVVLELDFGNKAFPIVDKMKSKGNKYSYPYAYINMDVKDAKSIKNSDNTFFQVIAVMITPDDVLNKKTRNSSGSVNGKYYLDFHAEVPSKTIGTAIVSMNPKKVIFAYGLK